MRRLILAVLLVLPLTAGRAEAVTLREIIDLSRAGLGEESLLALIEVDGGVFNIDPGTLKELKAAGVTERVIVALIRSGRVRQPEPGFAQEPIVNDAPVEAPPPQVIVIDHHDPPEVREVVVPVPVYVGVPVISRRHGRLRADFPAADLVPGAPTTFLTDTPPEKSREPVYWGWGGKLRPDAWKPTPRPAPERR